jgi:hypothetical protein
MCGSSQDEFIHCRDQERRQKIPTRVIHSFCGHRATNTTGRPNLYCRKFRLPASPCSRFYQRCNPFLQRYETTGRSTSELFDRKDISLFPQVVGKLRAKLNVDGTAIGKERGKSGMHLTFKTMIPLPTKITFIRICGRPADEVSHSQSS